MRWQNGRKLGWLLAVGGVLGYCVVSGLAFGEPKTGKAAPPFKPVMNVEQIMENQQAAMKAIKAAVLDKKWRDGQLHAWLLAELANVNRQFAEDEKYADFAGKMVDASTELAAKLKAKDAKGSSAALSDVGKACQSCHDVYRKKH